MAKKTKPPVGRKTSSKSNMFSLWMSITFVTLIIMSMPTVVIIFFGMLPTIVAFIIDRSKQHNASFCVGGINFCGVFPYLLKLWSGDNSMDMSIGILTDVFSLAIMYGAAGFGWMFYLTLSPVIATFLSVIAQHKVSTLRTVQRRLMEEWGEDVATPQEVLDMREEVDADEENDTASDQPSEGLDVDNFLQGIDNILETDNAPARPVTAPENGNSGEQKIAPERPPQSAAAGA